jgi:hypothetical protein
MDRYEKAALDAANRALAHGGCPPAETLMAGIATSAGECPIARTISSQLPNAECYVAGGTIGVELFAEGDGLPSESYEVALCDDAREFVERLDRGAYPALLDA